MGFTIGEWCTIILYPENVCAKDQDRAMQDARVIKKSRNEMVVLIALAILEGIVLRKLPKENRAYNYMKALLPVTGFFVIVAIKRLYNTVIASKRGVEPTNSSPMPPLELLTGDKNKFIALCQRLTEREKISIQKPPLSAEDSALLQELKQQVATITNQPLAEIEKLPLDRLLFLVSGTTG